MNTSPTTPPIVPPAPPDPVAPPAAPDAFTLINRAQTQLLAVERRYHAFAPVAQELERVTRGRRFDIRNDIVWRLVLDHRDMLVIDLASWARGMYGTGGFFGTFGAHHLNVLRRPAPPAVDAGELTRAVAREQQRLFDQWFVGAPAGRVDGACWEALRAQFARRFQPVVDDRSHNRAHKFEGRTSTTAMLGLVALRAAFDYAAQPLNLLRVLTRGDILDMGDMNAAPTTETARDLVDQILLGSVDEVTRARRAPDREAFYGAVAARADAAGVDATFHAVPPLPWERLGAAVGGR